MWIQIPYFCGQHAACWDPGSQWALDRAKQNLVDHYFLVGTTERLPEFVHMLEWHIPDIFEVSFFISKILHWFCQYAQYHIIRFFGSSFYYLKDRRALTISAFFVSLGASKGVFICLFLIVCLKTFFDVKLKCFLSLIEIALFHRLALFSLKPGSFRSRWGE